MDVRKTLLQIINDTGSEFSNKKQRREAAGLLRRLNDVEKKKSDLDPSTEEKMAAVAGRPVVCKSEFNPLAQVLRLGVIERSVQ